MSRRNDHGPPPIDPDEVATLKYMRRFQCIGGDCEDTCCYGWRVEVSAGAYERLEAAVRGEREERRRLEATFRPKRDAGLTKAGRPARYEIPLAVDAPCPMLEPDGACHIHRHFGEALLPDTCATYPRRFNDFGGRLELHGFLSCPEVVRQLLLPDDALEPATLPRHEVPRQARRYRLDTSDVRPLWRTQIPVRSLALSLLADARRPLENRLFHLAWFAHRTRKQLARDVRSGDDAALAREMALLRDPDVLDELDDRFAQLETPASTALIVARLIVDLGRHPKRTWVTYMDLVDSVLATYGPLRPLWQMAEDDDPSPSELDARPLWKAYRERRSQVRSRLGDRIDDMLGRIAQHYLHLRPNRDAPDFLAYVLRMLGELGAIKLLLYSHPRLKQAFEAPEDSLPELEGLLEEVAVEVIYKVARFVEHSRMLDHLEELFEERQMRSLAGAVYLIRL